MNKMFLVRAILIAGLALAGSSQAHQATTILAQDAKANGAPNATPQAPPAKREIIHAPWDWRMGDELEYVIEVESSTGFGQTLTKNPPEQLRYTIRVTGVGEGQDQGAVVASITPSLPDKPSRNLIDGQMDSVVLFSVPKFSVRLRPPTNAPGVPRVELIDADNVVKQALANATAIGRASGSALWITEAQAKQSLDNLKMLFDDPHLAVRASLLSHVLQAPGTPGIAGETTAPMPVEFVPGHPVPGTIKSETRAHEDGGFVGGTVRRTNPPEQDKAVPKALMEASIASGFDWTPAERTLALTRTDAYVMFLELSATDQWGWAKTCVSLQEIRPGVDRFASTLRATTNRTKATLAPRETPAQQQPADQHATKPIEAQAEMQAARPAPQPLPAGHIQLPMAWRMGDVVRYKAVYKLTTGQGTAATKAKPVRLGLTYRVLEMQGSDPIVECSVAPPALADLPKEFLANNLDIASVMFGPAGKVRMDATTGFPEVLNAQEIQSALMEKLPDILKASGSLDGIAQAQRPQAIKQFEELLVAQASDAMLKLHNEVFVAPLASGPLGEQQKEDWKLSMASGAELPAERVTLLEATKAGGFVRTDRQTARNSPELGDAMLRTLLALGFQLSDQDQRKVRDSRTSMARNESRHEIDERGWLVKAKAQRIMRSGLAALSFDSEVEVTREQDDKQPR